MEGKKKNRAKELFTLTGEVFGFRGRLTKVQLYVPSALRSVSPNCSVETETPARANRRLFHRCCSTLVPYARLLFDLPERREIGSCERTINPVDAYVVKAGKSASSLVVRTNPHRPIKRSSPSSHTLGCLCCGSTGGDKARSERQASDREDRVNLVRRSGGEEECAD